MADGSVERWRSVQALFDAALDLPPDEVERWLDARCGTDPELRAEVERLLHASDRTGGFLDAPAAEFAAPLLAREPELAAPPTAAGTRIGPYRIVRELGHGGMGTVFLAERADGHFEHRVALKRVRHAFATEDRVRRFVEERQILASMSHPEIARLLDGGVAADGTPYLVMEYVDGEPIDRYCDARRLPVEARLRLFERVCRAVQYAHGNLVVHRDLKPSNILVTADGAVKLLDFGIAKVLARGADEAPAMSLTHAGLRPMTPEYASPEQVRGDVVSTATDVYALGALLYTLLAGRPPHGARGRTLREIEAAVLETEPEPPSAVVARAAKRATAAAKAATGSAGAAEGVDAAPSDAAGGAAAGDAAGGVAHARGTDPIRLARRLRGDLDNIVLKALRKEPERRYATAEQLAADIHRHLAGLPVTARADTWRYRTRKFVRRHRVGTAAAAAFTLLLAGAATVTSVQASRIRAQAGELTLERDRAEEISDFLVDVFQASDPGESRGDTITALALLDRAADRIDRELAGQPLRQAEFMTVMARVYQNLGRYDRADTLALRAYELRWRVYGGDHVDVAESLNMLGVLAVYQARLDEAERRFRAALEMRRRLHGGETEEIATLLNNLGGVFHRRGDLDQAAAYYARAIEIRRRLHGGDDPDLAMNLVNLGGVRALQRAYDAADSLYRAGLAMQRRALGADHPNVINTLNNLGTLRIRRGDPEAAVAPLREALERARRVLPQTHPLLPQIMNNLGAALERTGDLDAAEPLYRDALALKRATLGDHHPTIATALNNLGLLLRAKGELDEAEPLLRESLALRRELYGDRHPEVARALANLAALESDRGHAAIAERLYRQALTLRRELLGDSHPDVARTALALGLLLHRRGDDAAAEPLLREAVAIRRAQPSSAPAWRLAEAESALGACLSALGHPDEAEPLLVRSYDVLRATRGAAAPETRRARERLDEHRARVGS
ncbi:MAG TPA: serine/threonine-protein kinase [Longimicrobiales bacterium]